MRTLKKRVFPRDPHDFYVEDTWTSAALFAAESFEGGIVDPSCGTGNILASAAAAGIEARGFDIVDRAPPGGMIVRDFMTAPTPCDNIVSNPPFKLCQQVSRQARLAGVLDFPYVRLALETAARKVALLLPTEYLNGERRGRFLKESGLYRVYILSPRPWMKPGAWVEGVDEKKNQVTDFAWFVWLRGYQGDPAIRFMRKGASDGGRQDLRGAAEEH